MKIALLTFLIFSLFASASQIKSNFAKVVESAKDKEVEKNIINKNINIELINNIIIKANILKKTDETSKRLSNEKALTNIYILPNSHN